MRFNQNFPSEIRHLLRNHARTFALTLAILPQSLREPLGLAYLLARVSDTIADAGRIRRERRIALLEELDATLVGKCPGIWQPRILPGELSDNERELMNSVPKLLAALKRSPERDEVTSLWKSIVEGQRFDLTRFPSEAALGRDELERYCGLVAGSVGEYWTTLIVKYSPRSLLDSKEEMKRLGCGYGKGLQLLNILRDRSEDRFLGRRYVEEGDLAELFELAEAWLRSGEKYLAGLRPGRLLMATALPYDLAMRTLRKIKRYPKAAGIRIPRREVRSALVRSVTCLCLPRRMNPAS